MLRDNDAMATIAVKDLATARKFYGDALGLREETGADNPEVVMFRSGHAKIMVYRSQYAGTNQATAATWTVEDDLDGIVQALKANGVTFEHYDLPDLTRRGDIHEANDGFRVVWLKDPDGNILSILSAARA